MSRRPRRNHASAFKAKVAIAAIKGDRTLVQLAEQFDVHPNQISSWKDQLLEGAAEVFAASATAGCHRLLVTIPNRLGKSTDELAHIDLISAQGNRGWGL